MAGIAIDQDTSLVYITTFGDAGDTSYPNPPQDRIMVYKSSLQKELYESGDVGNPAGIAVADASYKQPLLSITKDDNNAGAVRPLISKQWHEITGDPYNWLYYSIHWSMNGHDDSSVRVTDYLPFEVDEPNWISDGGVYDSQTHTVTWDLGSQGAWASGTLTIRVGVNHYAKPCSTIRNIAEIESHLYASDYAYEYTTVDHYGGNVVYVDKDATGFNNGTSWDNAYRDLQDAVRQAASCESQVSAIWVAAGTYKPTENPNEADATFALASSVGLFGHFGGIGTYETSISQRDFTNIDNKTILEGRIGTEQQAV